MKRLLTYFILLLSVTIVICGCSKERIEQTKVNGTYAIKYPFPNIVLELKNGKCVELYLETQDGLSFRTKNIRTGGKYPDMKYSCSVEGEVSGVCDIAATFSSPDGFIADVAYHIFSGEGSDAIAWAGNIEKMEFIRQAE